MLLKLNNIVPKLNFFEQTVVNIVDLSINVSNLYKIQLIIICTDIL